MIIPNQILIVDQMNVKKLEISYFLNFIHTTV